MRDGVYDGLGNPILLRFARQLAEDREPLVSGAIRLCSTPGCLRDVRAHGKCIECLEGPPPTHPPDEEA
jgi:hypothetical protein